MWKTHLCFLVFECEHEPRFFTLLLFWICLLPFKRGFSCQYYNSRNKWYKAYGILFLFSVFWLLCWIVSCFTLCRFQETCSSQQDLIAIPLMLLKWTCRMSYTIYLLEGNCHLGLWMMSSAWYLMLVTAMTDWMVCHSSVQMI